MSKTEVQAVTDKILSEITRTANPDSSKLSRRVLKKCIHETNNTVVGGGHSNLIAFNSIFKADLQRRNDNIKLWVRIVGSVVTISYLAFRVYMYFEG